MLSPVPMLRVTGRFLGVGLATSKSLRSMGMGESQPRGREVAGDGLFSGCQWGKNKELTELLWAAACPLPEGDQGRDQSLLSHPSRCRVTFPSHQEHLRGV